MTSPKTEETQDRITFRCPHSLKEWYMAWSKEQVGSSCPYLVSAIKGLKTGSAQDIPLKTGKKLKTFCQTTIISCLTLNIQVTLHPYYQRQRRYTKEHTYLPEKQVNPYLNYDVGSCGETVSKLIADY